jgi:hypothetical protein
LRAPRPDGPLTLFLGDPGGWTYYARPRLGGGGAVTAADVAAAFARLHELGLPVAIEWVHETTPSLLDAQHRTWRSHHPGLRSAAKGRSRATPPSSRTSSGCSTCSAKVRCGWQ